MTGSELVELIKLELRYVAPERPMEESHSWPRYVWRWRSTALRPADRVSKTVDSARQMGTDEHSYEVDCHGETAVDAERLRNALLTAAELILAGKATRISIAGLSAPKEATVSQDGVMLTVPLSFTVPLLEVRYPDAVTTLQPRDSVVDNIPTTIEAAGYELIPDPSDTDTDGTLSPSG